MFLSCSLQPSVSRPRHVFFHLQRFADHSETHVAVMPRCANRCSRHMFSSRGQDANVGLLQQIVVSDDNKFADVRASLPPRAFPAAAD